MTWMTKNDVGIASFLTLVVAAVSGCDGVGQNLAEKSISLSCEGISGSGTQLTAAADTGCLGCVVSDAQLAADGDLDSFASISLPVALASQGVSIRATAPLGVVFPAGRHAGIFFNGPSGQLQIEGNGADFIKVRTYLSGQLQESPENQNLHGTLGGNPYSFQSFQTTLPYDAVEVHVGGLLTADAIFEVYEICSDGRAE